MKNAFLMSPLIAAIVFAVPEAWQQIQDPGLGYVPVVNELLLLVFGYLAALAGNAVVIVPLCLLVRLKTSNLFAGLVTAFIVALIVTTVAYAFEIFEYQPHIFHPAYLFPVFLPLFVLTTGSFFFLARAASFKSASAGKEEEADEDKPTEDVQE